jgi:hypothetical protein
MAMTSKQRVLGAIDRRLTDYVPMCFLLFSGLSGRTRSEAEFVERQIELGLDVVVALPGVPARSHPEVRTEVWTERAKPNPLLHKVYHTPAGDLECIVERTADWPHGDDIPLMSDFVIPRARKFPVTCEEDLEPLRYLFPDPQPADAEEFLRLAEPLKDLAARHGLAVRAGFDRLADTVCWLCGATQFATMGLDSPGLLGRLIDLLGAWHRRRAAVALRAGPDILLRPEWYGTAFLSPALFGRYLAPALRQTAALAHEHGARLCYVATANVMPFLDAVTDAGADVLFGLDPLEGGWRPAEARERCRDRLCLWGGLNGYLQLVGGTPDGAERAVTDAMESATAGGGFILAPVDDVRIEPTDPQPDETWHRMLANIRRAVATWRRLR